LEADRSGLITITKGKDKKITVIDGTGATTTKKYSDAEKILTVTRTKQNLPLQSARQFKASTPQIERQLLKSLVTNSTIQLTAALITIYFTAARAMIHSLATLAMINFMAAQAVIRFGAAKEMIHSGATRAQILLFMLKATARTLSLVSRIMTP